MNVPLIRLGLLDLGMAFLFALLSFYAGIAWFKRYLRVPDLWKRVIRQNNAALALFVASFVAGTIYLMHAGASTATEIAASLFGERGTVPVSLTGFLLRIVLIYFASAIGSVLLLVSSLWLYDKHTPDLEELEAVRSGNLATGMLLSALCISVFILMEGPFATLFKALSPPLRNSVLHLREPFLNTRILWLGSARVALAMAGMALLCHLGLRFHRAIDAREDEARASRERNLGIAAFSAFSFVGFALFLRAGLEACSDLVGRLVLGTRPTTWILAQQTALALVLVAVSILLGVSFSRLGFQLFSRLVQRADPEKAIVHGSLPAAVVAGAFVLSLAVLMSGGTRLLLAGFATRPIPAGGFAPIPASVQAHAPRP